jgi:hypothetical protein
MGCVIAISYGLVNFRELHIRFILPSQSERRANTNFIAA